MRRRRTSSLQDQKVQVSHRITSASSLVTVTRYVNSRAVHCGIVCVHICICRCVSSTHQAEQVEKQVCVFSDQVVRLAAQVHKVVEATGRFVSSIDDICHVRGEDEGGAVSAGVT